MPHNVAVVGETLSRYHWIAHLGSGAMGDVYRAEDQRLRRTVALKVVRAAHDPEETSRRLLAEVRGYVDVTRAHAPAPIGRSDLLLPVHIRKDGVDLRMFSAIMTLGSPQDVTLQELRVETFFPADEASESRMRAGSTS